MEDVAELRAPCSGPRSIRPGKEVARVAVHEDDPAAVVLEHVRRQFAALVGARQPLVAMTPDRAVIHDPERIALLQQAARQVAADEAAASGDQGGFGLVEHRASQCRAARAAIVLSVEILELVRNRVLRITSCARSPARDRPWRAARAGSASSSSMRAANSVASGRTSRPMSLSRRVPPRHRRRMRPSGGRRQRIR